MTVFPNRFIHLLFPFEKERCARRHACVCQPGLNFLQIRAEETCAASSLLLFPADLLGAEAGIACFSLYFWSALSQRTFPTLIMISMRSTCGGYKAGAMPNQSVPAYFQGANWLLVAGSVEIRGKKY